MTKELVSFEGGRDIVIGIRYKATEDQSVVYEIVSATDYPVFGPYGDDYSQSLYYNVLGPQGDAVETFDEGLLLASGKIMQSHAPRDIASDIKWNYTVQFGDSILMFKKEYEAFHDLLLNKVIPMGWDFLNELNQEEVVPYEES